MYVTPLMEKLPHRNKAPVICIGDSLHPMTPFSGRSTSFRVHALFLHSVLPILVIKY